MDALIKLLKELNPKMFKGKLGKLVEYTVLLALLYGVYLSSDDHLNTAKANRDEQIKGIMVQVGVSRSEIDSLKEDNQQLREWLKAMSARVNRLEDVAIRGH